MDHDRQWYKAKVGVDASHATRAETFCTHVIDSGAPLVVGDAAADERFATNPHVLIEGGVRFYAGVPIHSPGGHAVGTLCVFDPEPRPRVGDDILQPLFDLAAIVEEIIAGRVRANVDELTGLQNRRGFFEAGRALLSLADRASVAMTLGYFDVDGLKEFNDTLGHEAGDQAIAATADLLRSCFRRADIIARIGGDEFVVLFAVTDVGGATQATQRVHESLAQLNDQGDRPFTLSVACGFIERIPGTATIEALVAEADAVMYERKRIRRAPTRTSADHT
jgi:diguanylate cyclase (GGDEF)-like protein